MQVNLAGPLLYLREQNTIYICVLGIRYTGHVARAGAFWKANP